VSAALGNYVSDNPSELGNFMSADTEQTANTCGAHPTEMGIALEIPV
jgi:hypothetical protein